MATLFGRYEYGGELGRGATGRVFGVLDRSGNGERRAVKVVPSGDAGRLIWEFSRLCQVEHPRIARVRELVRLESDAPAPFGLARGTLLLVEDFVAGAPLSSVLVHWGEAPNARVPRSLKVAIGVAEALTALHDVSLVHADVKPDNVLCDADGEHATLVDLGFARPPALASVPRGTPSYMAPELFAGVCTAAADVYALGALLYDCLRGEVGEPVSSHGERPWRARDLELLRGSIDDTLLSVLAQLLAQDLARRPSDAKAALGLLLPVAAQLGFAAEHAPLSYAALSFARSPSQRAERARTLPFTGHGALLRELADALAEQPVVMVRGARGAGRSRLVREAIRVLQERRASAGQRVPTWVSSFEALSCLRDVDAILWLEADDLDDLPALVRAASMARLALPSLHLVLVCAPEQQLAGARTFDVPPLPASDLEQLLLRLLEPDKPSREVSAAARTASLGLGGRLCELAAELLIEQRDVRDARAWQALAGEAREVGLSQPARELAVALAWWGRALEPEVFGRLLTGEATVAGAYDELWAKGLLSEGEAHVGLIPALATRLRRATREQRSAIAARLCALGARPDSAYARVATGDLEEAMLRFVQEARGLRHEGRTDAACALLEEACSFIPSDVLKLLLADAERARGRYAAGLAAIATLAGDDALFLRAELLRLSDRPDEARALLARLASDASPTTAGRARALGARLVFDGGDFAAAREAARPLLASADLETEVRALEVEVLSLLYTGDPGAAPVDRLVERATLRTSRGEREAPFASAFLERASGRALALRAQVLSARGERTRALGDLRLSVERMRALGEAHEAATYALNLGLTELDSGELGAAVDTLQEAAQRLAHMARSRDLARVLYNFAALALLVGDLERADVVLGEAERELTRAPDHVARAWLAVLRTELSLQRGALEAAEGAIEGALRELPDEVRSVLPVVAARATQVALARGRHERAVERLALAEAHADPADSDATLEVLTASLHVALAEGQTDRAERAAQRGLALVSERGGERVSFSGRLRFVLATIEVARLAQVPGSAPQLLFERTALARALLERALTTLPRELRAKMRGVPAYARVLTAEGFAGRAEGEPSRWRVLVRASRRLFAEPSGVRVAQRVAEIALELVHAERALVIAFGRDDDPKVIAQSELSLESERLPSFSRSVVERVALEGRSLMTIEARADERLERAASVQALHVRSVLCVELLGLSERAFLYLDDRLRPSAFGPEELALIEDLAELARQALRSSELRRSEARRARRAEQQQRRLSRELMRTQLTRPKELVSVPLIGESASLARVIATSRRVAASDAPVLITGESGTGKELLARFVHDVSPRKARAFVAESCAALPDTLLESALFGHVRGAFTGADRSRKGLFEAADGGTLFLDEVGEMSPSLQGKLLRVLQEGELRPLGSERTRNVDVRVIGATRRDLKALAQAGHFREDLYYRLAVVTLELPALRARPEDIPLLVAHFLEKHVRGRKVRIQPSALRQLEQRAWPGNVRELENEVRRALALCDGEIEPQHLSSADAALAATHTHELDLHARVERLTRELVEQAVLRADGNVTHAAALLGVSRFGLQKILKRLQLSPK